MYKQRLQHIARKASFPIVEYGTDHFCLTPQMIAELRELNYFDQWQTASNKLWFHLKLADHSLFLFSEGALPSYSFLHCPLSVVSFAEFLATAGVENIPSSRREYAPLYENVIDTASTREYVTPIRFDYHPEGYFPGVHPVAHIHIGLDNSVRLSSNKMNAVSFVLFVMRHMYPASWARLISKMGLTELSNLIRGQGSAIPAQHWTDPDKVELYFR